MLISRSHVMHVTLWHTLILLVTLRGRNKRIPHVSGRQKDFLHEAYVCSFATQGMLIRSLLPNVLKPVSGADCCVVSSMVRSKQGSGR
jgi:hypothetical protein